MAYNSSKGRGQYNEPIELKYIQIPHAIYHKLMIDYSFVPEHIRQLALWHFIKHYFTNEGYEALKVIDSQAYMICSALDAETRIVQNNARWKCFDEFYKGRNDIDFETAMDMELKDKRENKRERNRLDYLRRKQLMTEEILEKKKIEEESFLNNIQIELENINKRNNEK